MAYELIIAIISIIAGFLIAYYFLSRQKWGDKKDALDANWKNKFSEYKHQIDIRIEKMNKHIEVSKEKNKTELETVKKDWNVKYIKDIEELKELFKSTEKKIREKSVSASRRTLVGKFIERFVPFLKSVKYAPSDMHFLGAPIDYIVFDGLRDDEIKKVVFLEVKTGESKLTKREKSLKEAIDKKRVKWEQTTIDTAETRTPDKKIATEESSIGDLYKHIDEKLKTVRNVEAAAYEPKESTKKNEILQLVCIECNEIIELDKSKHADLESGIEIKCPHCKESVLLTEEDIAYSK